jgi:hypothetical protein
MSATTVNATVSSPGWLRSREFDLGFVAAIAGIGLLSGFVVTLKPELLFPIMLADLWLLGYHHVVSTFTRLTFDRESFRANRFIVLYLPPLVLAGVLAMYLGLGLWSIVTVYFYWQWFHYARQSWGVSQVYRRKAGGIAGDNLTVMQIAFYLLPVWGVLNRSYQSPETFLSMPIKVLPVAGLVVDVVGIAAVAGVLWFAATRLLLWWQGRLPVAHTLYVSTHFLMFYAGYILIDDISAGWLTVNIWHNAQYILFVWMFNNSRFKGGIEPKARFLSYISQTRNFWLYFLICVAISTTIYLSLVMSLAATALLIVSYQVLNFHHYIADSILWKVRRKSLQKTLGIAG